MFYLEGDKVLFLRSFEELGQVGVAVQGRDLVRHRHPFDLLLYLTDFLLELVIPLLHALITRRPGLVRRAILYGLLWD